MSSMRWTAAALVFALSLPAYAEDAGASDSQRISELEQTVRALVAEIDELKARQDEHPAPAEESGEETSEKLGVLARELDRLKTAVAVPEEKELESFYGLGPAASKVYIRDRGLALGGYGEVTLDILTSDADGRDNIADALRGVLYAGYKFDDWLVFNSELEVEHGTTESVNGESGSVSLEFLTMDFLLSEKFDNPIVPNIRSGLVLVPMGIINEMHEPTFFYGVFRPEPERQIIPTTWREMGGGIFGSIGDRFQYKIYTVNGLNAEGFSASGLRGGRQKGNHALANDWAFVGSFKLSPLDGLDLGGSVYTGDSGQGQEGIPDAHTTIWELHAQYHWKGLRARALYTQAHVGDTRELSSAVGNTIAKRMIGGYVEAGYDVLPLIFDDTRMRLEPFYRWSITQTQNQVVRGLEPDRFYNYIVNTIGVNFYPHPQVVIKAAYRAFNAQGRDSQGRKRPDEFNLGFGYVF